MNPKTDFAYPMDEMRECEQYSKDKMMFCPKCKKKMPVYECGFRGHNHRYECKKCRAELKNRFSFFSFSLFAIFILGLISLVGAVQIFDYNTNNIITSNNSFTAYYNWSCPEGLCLTKFIWNNINYTLPTDGDPTNVVHYQFSNFSSLGENPNLVADLSMYSNNGSITGCTSDSCNVTWNADGKIGGAFNFRNNLARSFIFVNQNTKLDLIKDLTISAWIRLNNDVGGLNTRYTIVGRSGDGLGKGFEFGLEGYDATEELEFRLNGNDALRIDTNYEFVPNTWYHVAVSYVNGSSCVDNCPTKLFVNGADIGTSYEILGPMNQTGNIRNITIGATNVNSATDQGSGRFNGTIDDVMIWNRSLSSEEIDQIYRTQLTKYNSENYSVFLNQSLNTQKYTYSLCITNSSNNQTCSNSNYVTRSPIIINFTFSNSIGKVRSDFYGTGLQSPKMFTGSIDTNCDGVSETTRDFAWQKKTFLDGGNKITYYDASLGSYYGGIYNLDFEWWSNFSVGFIKTSTGTGVKGWNIAVGNNRNATVYNTTDSHGGTYALVINSSIGSGNVYANTNAYLYKGNNYNFSLWMKGQGTITAYIWNASSFAKKSANFVLTDSWKEYSINLTTNDNDQTYTLILDLDGQINVTMDDFNLKQNGTNYRWWRSGNLTSFVNQLDWDYQNGVTDMLIIDYMPNFLANQSLNSFYNSSCLDNLTDTDTDDCMFNDANIWNNITLDFYKTLDKGRNYTFVEVWNEPYGGSFEDNLAIYSSKLDFVTLFNTTYNNFKGYNSNIKVIGYRSYNANSTFDIMMFSNLTTKFNDGFSIHPYGVYTDSDEVLAFTQNIVNNCNLYGATCDFISVDEWQPNYATRNESNGQSSRYKLELSIPYVDILNNYPSRVSMMYYHWDDGVSYFNCNSRYAEYPSFWSGVSEAGLDNPTPTYYPPYTVTKNFATYCPAGSTVYSSSSDDNTIKTVSCKDGNTKNIIIINTDTNSKNINLNIANNGLTYLLDSNGNKYSIKSNGIAELGILDSYGILYLTGSSQTATSQATTPVCNSIFSGYGEFIKYVPVFFGLIGVLLIVGFIALILYATGQISGESFGVPTNILEAIDLRLVFLGIFIIGIMMVVFIIILNSLCLI